MKKEGDEWSVKSTKVASSTINLQMGWDQLSRWPRKRLFNHQKHNTLDCFHMTSIQKNGSVSGRVNMCIDCTGT